MNYTDFPGLREKYDWTPVNTSEGRRITRELDPEIVYRFPGTEIRVYQTSSISSKAFETFKAEDVMFEIPVELSEGDRIDLYLTSSMDKSQKLDEYVTERMEQLKYSYF